MTVLRNCIKRGYRSRLAGLGDTPGNPLATVAVPGAPWGRPNPQVVHVLYMFDFGS